MFHRSKTICMDIYYRFFIRETRHRDHLITKEHRFWKKIHRTHLRRLNITEKQYKRALRTMAKNKLFQASPITLAKKMTIIKLETTGRDLLIHNEHSNFQLLHEEHLNILGITWKLLKKARELCVSQYKHLKPIQLVLLHNTWKDENNQRRIISHDEDCNRNSIYEFEKRYNHIVFFDKEQSRRFEIERYEFDILNAEIHYQRQLLYRIMRKDLISAESHHRCIIDQQFDLIILQTSSRRRVEKAEFCNRNIVTTGKPLPERVISWRKSKKLNHDVITHILEYMTNDIDSMITILRDMFNIDIPMVISQIFGFERGITFSILSRYNAVGAASYISKTQIKNSYHLPSCLVLASSMIEVSRRDRVIKYKQQDVLVQLVNIYNTTMNEKLKVRLRKYHRWLCD